MNSFEIDVKALRERARREVEKGPLTVGNNTDVDRVVELLNATLATEIVCTLRYRQHYHMASGVHSSSIVKKLQHFADEEQSHVELVAHRIAQLGGTPNYSPEGLLTRAHTEYKTSGDLVEMLKEDLIAERIVIEAYSEVIRFIGDDDPTTRNVLEKILADEEEHADELLDLITIDSYQTRTGMPVGSNSAMHS